MQNLENLRWNINAVDQQMQDLFCKRMEIAREIAIHKSKTATPIFHPDREQEIFALHLPSVPAEHRFAYQSFLEHLMRSSRAYQYRILLEQTPSLFPIVYRQEEPAIHHVQYQGVEGAYQEMASRTMFPEAKLSSIASWKEVFEHVCEETVDCGVVPLINSTAGSVNEIYDLLLQYNLFICKAHTQQIHHCLAVLPNTKLQDIQCVCSHPHALPQCSHFIEKNHLQALQMPNTALAAQYVQSKQDASFAAICSIEAAKRYGLHILSTNISNNSYNATRFIAITKHLVVLPNHNQVELAFQIPHKAGSLQSVLSLFSDYGIDLTGIYSRPLPNSPWHYVFYVNFSGNLENPNIRALLYQLKTELPFLQVLGSYYLSSLEDFTHEN